MAEKSSKQKSPQSVTKDSRNSPSAGTGGVAVAPPTYGIDFLDHAPAQAQARTGSSGGLALQREAGPSTAGNNPGAHPKNRTDPQKTPAPVDNFIPSMALKESIKNLPKMPQDMALLVLKEYQQFIISSIKGGEERIQELKSLRAERFSDYLFGKVIEVVGGTSLPSDHWEEPWRHVNAAYTTIRNRQVKESLENLLAAVDATHHHWDQVHNYLGQMDKGANLVVAGLESVRNVSFITLGVLAIIATGGAAAAGIGAATTTTAFGVEVGTVSAANLIATGAPIVAALESAGMRFSLGEKVDWTKVEFDVVVNLLLARFGGEVSDTIFKRMMGNPSIRSIGAIAFGRIFSSLMTNELSTAFTTSVDAIYKKRKGEKITWEKFADELVEQLLDPKGLVVAGIMGAVVAGADSKWGGERGVKNKQDPSSQSQTVSSRPTEPLQTVKPLPQKAVSHEPASTSPTPAPKPKPAELVTSAPPKRMGAVAVSPEGFVEHVPSTPKVEIAHLRRGGPSKSGLSESPRPAPKLAEPEPASSPEPAKLTESAHPAVAQEPLSRAQAVAPEPASTRAPAKSGSDQNVGPEPSFTLNISEKRAEQIRSGEKNFAIDRALTFDIDEVLPVGAEGIKPQRAVQRARDPYNRQLLDPNTNQPTKGLGVDVRELRENRGEHMPVSVVESPHALLTKRFSEVHELKRIFDRAVASVKTPQKLKPTELKAAINKETRRIIVEDTGPDAVAVRKALSDLGFEYQSGRGFVMMKEPPP